MKEKKKTGDSPGAGQVVKVSIEANTLLADPLSDHLVGLYDAAVEFVVDQQGASTVVHGFLEMSPYSDEKRLLLEQQVTAYAQELAAIFTLPAPLVSTEVIAAQDWSQKWKDHFKPFEIIPGLMVAPSWEQFDPPAGMDVITMDPGMAFGTGHHATTRLCLQMIQNTVQERAGCRVLDVGTGTGILAMAAALFGADRILGIDNDQDAVTAARDNVRINGLEDRVDISGSGLHEIEERCDIVVANIVHDVLLALAGELSRLTVPGGTLVLSGLIHGAQTEHIGRCFLDRGFRLVEQTREGEWGALRLEKIKDSVS